MKNHMKRGIVLVGFLGSLLTIYIFFSGNSSFNEVVDDFLNGINDNTDISNEVEVKPEKIMFKDIELEYLIRFIISNPDQDIYNTDVESIMRIDSAVFGYDPDHLIKSLDGLKELKNLRTINLLNAYLVDISDLSSLNKLEELEISFSSECDLDVLKDLSQLKHLSLQTTDSINIPSLSNLEKLWLNLEDDIDFDNLGEFTDLTEFSLGGYGEIPKSSDFGKMHGMNSLKIFIVSHYEIDNLNYLLELEQLEKITFIECDISNQAQKVLDKLERNGVIVEYLSMFTD